MFAGSILSHKLVTKPSWTGAPAGCSLTTALPPPVSFQRTHDLNSHHGAGKQERASLFPWKKTMNFIPSYRDKAESDERAWWFAFSDYKLLVEAREKRARIPCAGDLSSLNLTPLRKQFLGHLDGHPCYSAECSRDARPPEGMAFRGLRGLFAELGEELFTLAGRALQIMNWDRTHQFCGQCGTPTIDKRDERAKI
jgi:hypothetical protein